MTVEIGPAALTGDPGADRDRLERERIRISIEVIAAATTLGMTPYLGRWLELTASPGLRARIWWAYAAEGRDEPPAKWGLEVDRHSFNVIAADLPVSDLVCLSLRDPERKGTFRLTGHSLSPEAVSMYRELRTVHGRDPLDAIVGATASLGEEVPVLELTASAHPALA